MADDSARPIIIRRKVVKAAGHHGGAWKVAYADFVTAMMAFFLLMWLLNATTEDQRKGLADYFSPSIPVHRTSGGGDGPFGGDTAMSENALTQNGRGATDKRPSAERAAAGAQEDALPEATLKGLAEALDRAGGESEVADDLLQHVRLRRTDEGLVIELAELPGAPLFGSGTAQPTRRLAGLMALVAGVVSEVSNRIAVDSHLEQRALARPASPGWQLTSTRALAARIQLAEAGVAPQRFARVAGRADRAPSWPDPRDLRNRRLEVILLVEPPN
ncbi:chemotaxis protein MotB [Rhodobacteraceae bacterium 2CG4]|uniref:Chemotaxis protein MotB n=1 Tax=Halovulum marinum TaxID=2662447 RepID=A0A6L5Z8I4_9RHOB|nr:flagellar motor protein MotB [Halovulum marinum]MSU92325.1 chemotaxis protein MotB [Halovulum marinum]